MLSFDQPLFQKATQIILNSDKTSFLKHIVLRLGAIHTEMSFLGSTGYLLSGSALQEVLETVYAPKAVNNMTSGKAVSRALRGHLLVDTALHALLLSNLYNIDLPLTENLNQKHDKDEHENTYDSSERHDDSCDEKYISSDQHIQEKQGAVNSLIPQRMKNKQMKHQWKEQVLQTP